MPVSSSILNPLTIVNAQLHMIENRLRLERQIFLGRQATRKVQQTKHKDSSLSNDQSLPTLINPNPTLQHAHLYDLENPLSDIDTEDAQRIFTRSYVSSTSNTAVTNGDAPGHQLRSSVTHRKWAADAHALEKSTASEQRAPEAETSTGRSRHSGLPRSGSFLERLRTQSFPGLPSPFATLRRNNSRTSGKEPSQEVDPAWSSDSSSGDDLSLEEQRRMLPSSRVNLVNLFDKLYPEDEDDDGVGDSL